MIKSFLIGKGYSHLVDPPNFTHIKPCGADIFNEWVKKTFGSRHPCIFIHGDSDVDGISSIKIMLILLRTFGFEDINICRLTDKHHGIDEATVYDLKKKGCTHLIIVDSSTNNLEELKLLKQIGINTVVFDHHIPDYNKEDYKDIALIFNQKLDIKSGEKIAYPEVSCGMLCAMYTAYVLSQIKLLDWNIYVYGVLSLYSDSMDTTDKYNAMIINMAEKTLQVPFELRCLSKSKKKSVSRHYLSYSIIPKLNNAIRSENFELISALLFVDKSKYQFDESQIGELLDKINGESKEYLNNLYRTTLKSKVVGNIGLLDITSLLNTTYLNYKGYLCQQISDKVEIQICYYLLNGYIHGSVRDSCNRNIIDIFSQVMPETGGHGAAFGFKVSESQFWEALKYVNLCLDGYSKVLSQPFIFSYEDLSSDDLKMIRVYNEYATQSPIIVSDVLDSERYRISSGYGSFTATTEGIRAYSRKPITYGQRVLFKPTIGNIEII